MVNAMVNGSFSTYSSKVFSSGVNVLGLVSWMSLVDVRIPERDAKSLASACGLSDAPKPGAASDAFRRATTAFQKRGEERRERFLMRPIPEYVGPSGSRCVERQVVLETVIGAQRRRGALRHVPLVSIVFDYGTQHATRTSLPYAAEHVRPQHVAEAERLASEALKEYESLLGAIDGSIFRRFVMSQMDARSTIAVHPHGGVYFSPATYVGRIEQLRDFVSRTEQYVETAGAKHVFHCVPVPDVDDQRKHIAASFDAAMKTDVSKLVGDVAELLGKEKVGQHTLSIRRQQLDAMRKRIADYKAIVDVDVSEIEASMFMVDTQIDEIDTRSGRRRKTGRSRR